MKKRKTLSGEVTLSIVAKTNDDVDPIDFLKKNTEWLGEPRDASGCVVAVSFKSFKENKA